MRQLASLAVQNMSESQFRAVCPIQFGAVGRAQRAGNDGSFHSVPFPGANAAGPFLL